jgi:adenosylhomocysteine nucleosidase
MSCQLEVSYAAIAASIKTARRFAAIILMLVIVLTRGSVAVADPTGQIPRIAVISAFTPEWLALQGAMSDTRTQTIADTTYIVGRLKGKDVVLFLSGVSMVNAAMTTQAAIDHFKITRIIFSGIAGGVNPALHTGDVVVADRWYEYLESVFARKTPTGWSVPEWLGKTLPNYGMIFPHAVEIAHPGQSKPEKRFWFDVDSAMLDTARSVAGNMELKSCVKPGVCFGQVPRIIVGGAGVSGTAFVDNRFSGMDFRHVQGKCG